MILAEKIIMLRKRNGWSQEELAAKMNVSRQSVSKWESTASVPDLDKIIKLSQIFEVSTDYLLKDEVVEETSMAVEEEYAEDNSRNISLEDANLFMELSRKYAVILGISVAALVLSPTILIFLAGLSEYKGILSENMAGGAGVIIFLLIVCVSVAVLIFHGMKMERYEYMEQESLKLQYGVEGIVRKRQEEFAGANRICTVMGVVLCILSVIPLMMAAAFNAGDFIYIICVDVLLLFVACGVFLFIWSGVINGSHQKLLEEGEYTWENKQNNKKNAPIGGIYWCTVTAIYLGISFYTMRWDRSWIIWPCAGVFFAALCGILNLVRKK